jgi:hypothetical protein
LPWSKRSISTTLAFWARAWRRVSWYAARPSASTLLIGPATSTRVTSRPSVRWRTSMNSSVRSWRMTDVNSGSSVT